MPKKKILVADDDLGICHADTAVRCIFRKLRIVRGKHQGRKRAANAILSFQLLFLR